MCLPARLAERDVQFFPTFFSSKNSKINNSPQISGKQTAIEVFEVTASVDRESAVVDGLCTLVEEAAQDTAARGSMLGFEALQIIHRKGLSLRT